RFELVRQEGLLEPEDVQLLQLARDPNGGVRVSAIAEPGVDQDVDAIAGRRASCPGQADIVVRIATKWAPAQLDGGEPEPFDQAADLPRRLDFGIRHQGRRIRADTRAKRRSNQLRNGFACRLPLDIPQSDVNAANRV